MSLLVPQELLETALQPVIDKLQKELSMQEKWVLEQAAYMERGSNEWRKDMQIPEQPYGPYADSLGYLTGGANISCRTLSPALRCFIKLLPEVAADRSECDVEGKYRVLLYPQEDSGTRPLIRSEVLRLGNRAVLDAVEDSLLATAHAHHMVRMQELTSTRGDLQQILDLLKPD